MRAETTSQIIKGTIVRAKYDSPGNDREHSCLASMMETLCVCFILRM